MKSWLVSSHVALSCVIHRTRASFVQRRLSFLVFLNKSARKLVAESPTTVDLSLIVAAVTLAPTD